jgi:hypothetical protein
LVNHHKRLLALQKSSPSPCLPGTVSISARNSHCQPRCSYTVWSVLSPMRIYRV